jgi:hypothetical protein
LDLDEILDVSEAGMSFRANSQMALGRRFKLCLDLPETASSVRTVGQVVWSEPSGLTGVRFLKLRGRASRQLREWLFMNALVACVHGAAVQARAENSERSDDASVLEVVRVPPLEQPGALTQTDYADILTRVAEIRREVEGKHPHLESSLQFLAEQAMVFTGASGAAVALSRGEDMICRASVGSDAPGVGARFQMGSGFSGECVRSGVSLRCDDSETDARVDRETCRVLGIRSMMASPIRDGYGVLGLLEVFSRHPFAFSGKDRIFLQRLTAVILASMQRRSIRVSVTAKLTGANDHATEAAATEQIELNPLGFGESADGRVFSGEIPGGTPPPADTFDTSPRPRLRWVLSVAAVAALILAVSLFTPGLRTRFASSTNANPPVPLSSQQNTLKAAAGAYSKETSLERLRRLAEQGDATAQFALGAHYAIGDEVKQDYSTAAQWFSQAADQGHVVAQATLGAYYWAGTGVPEDLDKAYFWSVLAQAGGDEASKYRLSALASQMTHGQVVAAQEEANDWLRQHELANHSSRNSRP